MSNQRIGMSWWDMIGKRSVSLLLSLMMIFSCFNLTGEVAYADEPTLESPADWADWEWYQSPVNGQYYKVYQNTQLPYGPYDVSSNGDGSVMAEVIKNEDDTYTLVISGNGTMSKPWLSGAGGTENGIKKGKYFYEPDGNNKLTTLIVKDGVECISSSCLTYLYYVEQAIFEGDIAIKDRAAMDIGKNSKNGLSIVFNGIVDEIGYWAFRTAGRYSKSESDNPRATVSVLFKEKVYSIGEKAFEGLGQACGLDVSVIAKKDVEEIGPKAFKDAGSYCNSINIKDKINKSWLTDNLNYSYTSGDVRKIFSTTRIGYYQTLRTSAENVYKPTVIFDFQGTVGYIGDRAFQYVGKCVKKLSIYRSYQPEYTFPGTDYAVSLESYAFVGERAEITLRSTMEKIPEGCFYGFGQGSKVAKLNLDFPNASEVGSQAFYQTYVPGDGKYQPNLSGNNVTNGSYSNQAVGSDIKDMVSSSENTGLASLQSNTIAKTRLFDIRWKQDGGDYTNVLPISITSFGQEAFFASGYNPGRIINTIENYGIHAFDNCYELNVMSNISVDKLHLIDPSVVNSTTLSIDNGISVKIVPADPSKGTNNLRHGQLLTFEYTNNSSLSDNELFYKVSIQKGNGSSVQSLYYYDGFDMIEYQNEYQTDAFIAIRDKKYFAARDGEGNTITIDVYQATKNSSEKPIDLKKVATFTTDILGHSDLRSEIDGNSLMTFVGQTNKISQLMSRTGILHIQNSTTCFVVTDVTGTNIVSGMGEATDTDVARISSTQIKGLHIGSAAFTYNVCSSNCFYHGTEDLKNVTATLYVFANPVVDGNSILLDHRGPIIPASTISPTNVTTTTDTPTNTTPTNTTPTNTTPTNTTPTNTTPTNTTPTNTTPTNTTPTNTTPAISPELAWLGTPSDWEVSLGDEDYVPLSSTNLFDNLEYATAYRVIYRHRIGGTDAAPIYQYLFTTVCTSTPVISFNLRGGTLNGSASPSDILSTIVPTGMGRPRNARMIFTGWYYDALCTLPAKIGDKITEDSITLYAGWAKRSVTPSISMRDFAVEPNEITDTDLIPTLINQTNETASITWFYSSDTNVDIPLSVTSMSDILRHLPAGSYYLKAVTGETYSYNAASATTLFNVMKRDRASGLVSIPNITYNGEEQTLIKVQIASNSGSKVRFATFTDSVSTPGENDWIDGVTDSDLNYYVQAKDAGTYYVWYQVMGKTDNPDPMKNTIDGFVKRQAVTIKPKTLEFVWCPAQKQVTTITFTDTEDSDSDGDTTEIIQNYSVLYVTTTDLSYKKEGTVASGYTYTFVYDGTPRYVIASATNLEAGDVCNINIEMVEPDDGASNVNAGSFHIVTGTLTDVSGDVCTNYQLSTATATCIIYQREVGLIWSTPTDYTYDSMTDLYSFGHKYTSSTTTNLPKNFVFDTTAKIVTASASNVVQGDTVGVCVTLTNLKDNVHAGTFTFVATSLTNLNYKLPVATESNVYTIEKDAQFTRAISLDDYVYGRLLSVLPDTPTDIVVQENPDVNWYYSSDGSKINRTWTAEDIQNYSSGTDATVRPWNKASISELPIGLYYVKAVIHETSNYEQGQSESTFMILKGKKATPSDIMATGEGVVTVDVNDRNKDLEYTLLETGAPDTGTEWKTVTLDDSGTYRLPGLAADTDYIVYLREKGDSNEYESDWVKVDLHTSLNYSVYFDANGGSGTVPDPIDAQAGTTVKAPMASKLTKTGYMFNGWNTKANGNGTDYAVDSDVSDGMILYAKWTPKTYKIVFNANGGKGEMNGMNLTYGEKAPLPTCEFTKKGYQFAGWATTQNGAVRYLDGQDVMNLADGGTATLYGIWVKDLYRINVIVNSISTSDTNIAIQKGNEDFMPPKDIVSSKFDEATDTNIIAQYQQTLYTGAEYFENLPSGIYDVVVTQNIKGKAITMTKAVVLANQDATIVVDLPEGDTSSVLDVKENAPLIVVDGLDREALTKYQPAKRVKVLMTIEMQEDKGISAPNSPEESLTQSAIKKIKDVAIYGLTPTTDTNGNMVKQSKENRIFEFFNIDVEQRVTTTTGGISTEETVPLVETNTLCSLIIPYDMIGKNSIKVYRYHNGKVDILDEVKGNNSGDNIAKGQEGTFCADKKAGIIYIYASKFSTYAISYTKGRTSNYRSTIESPDTGDVGILLYSGLAVSSMLVAGISATEYRRKKNHCHQKNGKN